MKFTISISVTGSKATLEAMPFVVNGSENIVECKVAFDEVWEDFTTRTLLFRRGVEPPVELALDEEGCATLPSFLTDGCGTFYLSLEGSANNCRICTNRICLSFRYGEREGRLRLFQGPYTITENGVYPVTGCLMGEDLVIQVPQTTEGGDTEGGSTGNNEGNATGDNTGGNTTAAPTLQVVYSQTAPADTSKVWVKTSTQPAKQFVGQLTPPFLSAPTGTAEALTDVQLWIPAQNGIYLYGTTAGYNGTSAATYTPRLLFVGLDGTLYETVVWPAVTSLADAAALAGYVTATDIYLLLGSDGKNGTEADRRGVRVQRCNLSTKSTTTYTVTENLFCELSGGICATSNGVIYLYYIGKSTPSSARKASIHAVINGNVGKFGSDQTVAYAGRSGMAVIGTLAYTAIQTSANKAITINLSNATTGTWTIPANCPDLHIVGAADNLIELGCTDGMRYLKPLEGVMHHVPFAARVDGEEYTYHGWLQDDGGIILYAVRKSDGAVRYTRMYNNEDTPSAQLLLHRTEGTPLTLLNSDGLQVTLPVLCAFVTDASHEFQEVPVSYYNSTTNTWVATT